MEIESNENSILICTKKMLGIPQDPCAFDTEITIHINTVLANLVQMGIGPKNGYIIDGIKNVWTEFTDNNKLIEQIKTYMYIKVRLLFDPPSNSTVLKSYQDIASELEIRMYTQQGGY